MTDMEEFLEEKLGIPWEPDQNRIALVRAINEYHESCEAYDRTVCTKQVNSIAVPETDRQMYLICRNARSKREELLCRVSRELGLTRETAEDYWKEAMRDWRPGR